MEKQVETTFNNLYNNQKITAASFLLSEQCNLRCKYCFELGHHNNQMMSEETIKKGINFLFDNAIASNTNSVHVLMFGGEPTLNVDGIQTVFEYGYEMSQRTNIGFTTGIITNGTIMNDKLKDAIEKWHDKCNLTVQISLDGIKESHDLNRVYANGKGSFDVIMKNIPIYKKILNADKDMQKLCIHTCLSQSNMPYFFESWKYFMFEMKVPFIWFMPIHSDGYTLDDVKSYKTQLVQIAEVLLNKCFQEKDRERGLQWIRTYSPLDKCLNMGCSFGAPCGAGKTFGTITANGDIYPCHQIYYNDEEKTTKLGSIYSECRDKIDEGKRFAFLAYDNHDLSCFEENPECNCFGCYRCLADNWCRTKTLFTTVRGERCMMSHIERDVQSWMKDELAKRGYFGDYKEPEPRDNKNNHER